MEIDINENFNMRLTKIFNPIELVAENQRLAIAQRDGIFEIKVLEGAALQQPDSEKALSDIRDIFNTVKRPFPNKTWDEIKRILDSVK